MSQLVVDKRFSCSLTDKIAVLMQLNEKIRFIRHIKKWSQEEVAHRLGMSPSAYGSIERGEIKLSLPRLEEIARVFEIDLAELVDFNEKNIFNFGGTHNNHCHTWHNNSSSEQLIELQHELEKARLLLQEREKEIAYLKELIALLKNNQQT